MNTIVVNPVSGPVAWYGSELSDSNTWTIHLNDRHIAELDAAMRHALGTGAPLQELSGDDFPLPTFADELQKLRRELQFGRGFALFRGLPVDRYSETEAGTIFWGLGTHLGSAVSQNARGDLLGHVRDQGLCHEDPDVRGYQTRALLPFHTDSADIVGLLCLQTAREGGLSAIASSMTVYNELLCEHPELIGVLYTYFDYDRRGEEATGDSPVYRQPVYSYHEGYLSCRYVSDYIYSAQHKTGRELSPVEREALEAMQRLASGPHLRLDMDFQPGDMQFLHNSVILHSRTEYVDHPEPERKRHLLRLWLNANGIDDRPHDPAFTRGRSGVPVTRM